MRVGSAVFCVLGALAATACERAPRSVEVALVAPEALGCRPTELTSLRVSPLGDFPTEVRPSAQLDPRGGPQAIDRFPPDTQLVAVDAMGFVQLAGGGTAPWRGGGLVPLDQGDVLRVPLLRFGRACALSDPSARVPRGAVALALPDGRLLVAGGQQEQVLATVLTVRPGETLARASEVRLFSPRTGASGTLLEGGRIVVAGGAVADAGPVLDTVELLRVTEAAEERLEEGFLLRPRRDHVALLSEGRVLLVGGRDDLGAVADADWVSVDDGIVSEPAGRAVARWGATGLTLDDGTRLVVGGEGDEGPAGEVERLDDGLAVVAELPPREGAAWAALTGGRAARFGGRGAEGWTGRLEVLLDRGETVVDLGEVLAPLEDPVALGLPDGRLAVVGREAVTGRAVGAVVDPGGTRALASFEPARLATRLVRLADGTIVEADAEGMSLLRLDLANPFDDPQATLFPAQPEQRAELSLAEASAWTVQGDLLTALRDDARLDLPTARFLEVRAELEVVGDGRLLLQAEGAAPYVVELTETELRFGECVAPRASPVVLERVGDALRLGNVRCDLEEPGRVALGLSLARGAGLRRLSVARLDPG